MRLRTWALPTRSEGARSPVNCQYPDVLLLRGCPGCYAWGVTITPDQTMEQWRTLCTLTLPPPPGEPVERDHHHSGAPTDNIYWDRHMPNNLILLHALRRGDRMAGPRRP